MCCKSISLEHAKNDLRVFTSGKQNGQNHNIKDTKYVLCM